MSHTPYGYRIENGLAVIDQEIADKIEASCIVVGKSSAFRIDLH